MIERHQDYILTIPTLAAGQRFAGFPLPLDTDAPFLLRGRGIHIAASTTNRRQSDVLACSFRYKNAKGNYLADQLITTPQDYWGAFGQNGNYRPVWPQQTYQPGGQIVCDFFNGSANMLTNLQLIFRGVKLFQDGALSNPTYPASCKINEFTYQTGKGTLGDQPIILQTTDALYQLQLSIQNDADFVVRGAQAGAALGTGGPYSPYGYTELYIQLFDHTLKPYSNAPIHIDWLFGNAGGPFKLSSFVNLGNSAPGLVVPEIYLQKNRSIYYNLFRNDAPYIPITDDLPTRLQFAWIGSKVYA